MKNIANFALIIMTTICLLSGCSTAQVPTPNKKASETLTDKKALIVYLSRTNNTKAIAEIIQKNVGGELVSLELEKPYPENYKAIVGQVVKENETGFLPPLKTKIEGIEKYDAVFVGFPTWGMQLPPPMKSFLRQYDLSGKTVIPFNSNAGYGVGSSFQTVKELSPNSTVLEGFSTKGGIERDGVLFELIVGIELPKNNFANKSYYLKVRDRASYAFALVAVAAALETDGNKIKQARIVVGGVAHKPWRSMEAEKALTGNPATDETFNAAAEAALKDAKPLAHNGYKVELGKRSIVLALQRAFAGGAE